MENNSSLKQGRVWRCTHCGYQSERAQVRLHVLRQHTAESDVPSFCRLCGFQAFYMQQLVKHCSTFNRHKRTRKERGITRPDANSLVELKS